MLFAAALMRVLTTERERTAWHAQPPSSSDPCASHAAAASTPKARGSIVTLALSRIIGWQRFSNANFSGLPNTHKDASLIRATIL